jgi:hypothetical protein
MIPYAAADAIESLRAENARLTKQVANLEARGIHSCNDECQRPLCVAQRENARLREALEGIISHFDSDQGPGHSHAVPGIWDDDNPPHVAGTRCDWCAHWEDARALAHKDVNANIGGTDA